MKYLNIFLSLTILVALLQMADSQSNQPKSKTGSTTTQDPRTLYQRFVAFINSNNKHNRQRSLTTTTTTMPNEITFEEE